MDTSTCYLCGHTIVHSPQSVADEFSMDHVPPKQFFPKELRIAQSPNLWVAPSHKRCNEEYRKDEEYVYHAMFGVVQKNNHQMGQTILRDFARRTHRRQTPAMMRSILKSFTTITEGGIYLPPRIVQLSVDQYRTERVVIKIAQGVLYRDLGCHMPHANCKDIRLCLVESDVPESYSLSWQGAECVSVCPEVFSYRRFEFDGLQLLSMLFWEAFMFCCAFENVSSAAALPVVMA
jgi:hypothetical protein